MRNVKTCASCGTVSADDARFCSGCGLTLVARVDAEERRVVTALFADLVGSTALGERIDPEVMRGVVGRFFELASAEIRRHGGGVERFSGDAVLGVFGLQAAHEDDPERAVRAAVAIRDGLAKLEADAVKRHGSALEVRFGIESGEVVVGDPFGGGTMATGDPVNVAARLQQQAAPGEIVIGHAARSATASTIGAEPLGTVALKGRAEPVDAWRVTAILGEVGTGRGVPGISAPLTGRDGELAILLDAARRTKAESKPILFTVLGAPGVGKSRLARELADRLSADGAVVLRGRCLPYGDGITYWPLSEMVRGWASISPEVTVADATVRLRELCPDDAVADRIAFAIGLSSEAPASESVDREIAWAFRRLFESLKRDGEQLLFVFEDIHWAEPTLLDLIEYLATWVRGIPALVLCLARPELLDARPTWGAGRLESGRMNLEPLSEAASSQLLASLLAVDNLPAALRHNVLERAEGNPLYVEEVVRMLIDRGVLVRAGDRWVADPTAAEVTVPESVEALIRARLDTLSRADRALLQTASVIGRVFDRSAVVALAGDAPNVDERLDEAVLRDLIIEEPRPAADRAYRFKHILIRDAAYASLPKARRAALHLQVADWLDDWAGERRDEFVEIAAYHLEQAAVLQRELHGSVDAALEARAVDALVRGATLSLGREDLRAAERFARRALALEPRDATARVEAKWLLTDALINQNRIDATGPLGREVADEAARLGRRDLEGRGLMAVAGAMWIGPDAVGTEEALRVLGESKRLLEQADDREYLFEATFMEGFGDWAEGRLDAAADRWNEAVRIARSIPDGGREARVLYQVACCRAFAGRLDEAIPLIDASEDLARAAGSRRTLLAAARVRAVWLVAARSTSDALRSLEALLPALEETGDQEALEAAISNIAKQYHLAGDLESARAACERALEISRATAHSGRIPEVEATLADIVLDMGDLPSAEAHAQSAVETAGPWDATAVARASAALGRVRGAQGRQEEAERLLREAVKVMQSTEYRAFYHDVMAPLAWLLLETGRAAEGEAWLDRALASARSWGEDSALVRSIERHAADARARATQRAQRG